MYIVYITFDTMLKGIIHYFSCCQKALQLPRTFNHDTSLENDNCVVEAFHHCWYKIIVRQFKNRQEEKQRKYNCNKFRSQSQTHSWWMWKCLKSDIYTRFQGIRKSSQTVEGATKRGVVLSACAKAIWR